MSEHRATVRWARSGPGFDYETYSRDHRWDFGAGLELPASAAAEYRGSEDRVDPEQAFVASLSSCHMLTFLAIAARKRLVVDAYEDHASGRLAKNEAGRLAITRVVLRPRIRFAGDPPSAEQIARMHETAHANCFIASSVRCDVVVEEPGPAPG